MSLRKDFTKLAKKYGFFLKRRSKHCIWEHPDTGARIVTGFSPSDQRSLKNFELMLQKNTANPYWNFHHNKAFQNRR